MEYLSVRCYELWGTSQANLRNRIECRLRATKLVVLLLAWSEELSYVWWYVLRGPCTCHAFDNRIRCDDVIRYEDVLWWYDFLYDIMMCYDDAMMLWWCDVQCYYMLGWWCIMMWWHEMHDDDMTWYEDISCYDDVHVWNDMLHYNKFSNTQLPNDECMKAYACMLPRLICEECVGLCHVNDFRMKSIRTSCILYTHLHRDTSCTPLTYTSKVFGQSITH